MSDPKQTFYLTTPIYYVNARPHIGHAYTTIVADVLARRHRLLGDETFFLTGTDEHGQKIERSAAAAGIPPQEFTDKVAAEFKSLWDRMGITYDKFIRTTSPEHAEGVQQLWRELEARGFIYLSSYTGSYCVSDEAFVDAPVGTPCPDCGRLLEEVTEENYFFKLSEFQRPLIDLIESGELKIENDARHNEVLSFVRGPWLQKLTELNSALPDPKKTSEEVIIWGLESDIIRKSTAGNFYLPDALKDLSISRSSFKWGIPVPGNDKHVVYVWLDALANYITALGYGSDNTTNFEKFWPADLHLVGKEIIRFHCVYWPAFLLAAGLPLPKAITAHGWLLFDNSKMSKSRGNIVRTETILDTFGEQFYAAQFPETTKVERDLFAADILRYYLLAEIPWGESGDFNFESLLSRYNSDLANGYGNFVSRTLSLIHRYRDGIVPEGYSGRVAPLIAEDNDLSIDESELTRKEAQILEERIEENNKRIKEEFLKSLQTEATQKAYSSAITSFENFLVKNSYSVNFRRIEESSTIAFRKYLLETHEEQTASSYSSAVKRLRDFASVYKEATLSNVMFQAFAASLVGSGSEVVEPFNQFISQVRLLLATSDSYIATEQPWNIAKVTSEDATEKLSTILYAAAESIRIITALLYPIMPYATSRVWAQLGLGNIELAAKNGELKNLQWGGLKPGTKLGVPLTPIFPRADKSLIETMINMENETTSPSNPTPDSFDPAAPPRSGAPHSDTLPVGGSTALTSGPDPVPPPTPPAAPVEASIITIDDFAKIELRVAQIVVAERIPKADKLLRLEVDLGPDFPRRQILSGIAEWYTPEELLGRKIVVITNLAPRKMRGLESHGMLLAASTGENGKPVLATMAEDIALGSRLK